MTYMYLDAKSLVKTFTYADEIQDQNIKEKRKRDLGLAIVTGLVLFATAITSAMIPFPAAEIMGVMIATGLSNVIASVFIGVTTIVRAHWTGNT